MPQNAFLHPDELPAEAPLDLQLDLLVDGELAEARRQHLLVSLDKQPDQWRSLAIRFLQQQTEKQSVRALMAGGKIVPVEIAAPSASRRPIIGRIGWYRLTAVAAALFIAASSAFVTLLVVKPLGNQEGTLAAEFKTSLPADVIEAPAALPVSVPVVRASDDASFFPNGARDKSVPSKTTLIVQPDGKGGYMVIPVSMTKSPVY